MRTGQILKTISIIILSLLLTFGASSLALAETSLKGHDSGQPIDFVADRFEVNEQEHYAVFEGAVVATQGDLKFMTETLRVFYEDENGNDGLAAVRLDARGHIRLESPTESAEGNWGIYDIKSRTITIVGDVVLRRADTVITGQRLEIDLDTGLTKFDGLAFDQATGQPGRVTGRFYLPENSK